MKAPSPELERLVAAYLAGSATPTEVKRLSEWLRNDATARDCYLKSADVHAGLLVNESLWGKAEGNPVLPLVTSKAPRRHPWIPLALAANLVACIAFGIWWKHQTSHQMHASGTLSQGQTLATLSRTSNAQWGGACSNYHEGMEVPAGDLKLLSGTAQVDVYSGVRLILVGPADLEILSTREARLQRGRMTCEVDEQGRGFRLAAPGMQVVDLGTAFGLKVPDNDQPEVHVLEGKVAVALTGGGHFTELSNAQALCLANGSFKTVAFASNEFPRSTDLQRSEDAEVSRRFLAWREAAVAMDRDPAVLVHYTFDMRSPKGVVNLAQANAHGSEGMIIGAQASPGRWPGKGGLEFRRRGDRVLFRLPGTHESLTFAMWVRVDAYQEKVTALLVTEESKRWQGLDNAQAPVTVSESPYTPLRWELRNDGQLALNWQRLKPAGGRAWHIHWADTELQPERLGCWALLASVVDGSRREVIHYVNGRELARRPAEIQTPFALTRVCLGNLSSTEAEARAGIRYGLFGKVDEVIVADRAFTAAEIARLYNAGKP